MLVTLQAFRRPENRPEWRRLVVCPAISAGLSGSIAGRYRVFACGFLLLSLCRPLIVLIPLPNIQMEVVIHIELIALDVAVIPVVLLCDFRNAV